MKTISATDLHTLLQESESPPLLLDVREPSEFDYCRIEASQLIPMQTVPQHLNTLPKDKTIITICHHGMRSQQVAQYLLQQGFTDVINLTGGVHAWARDVDNSMPTY